MSDKSRPSHRIITKKEGDEKFTELAAAWTNASGQVTVTFSQPVAPGTRALWVENKPREAAKPQQ